MSAELYFKGVLIPIMLDRECSKQRKTAVFVINDDKKCTVVDEQRVIEMLKYYGAAT